MTEKTFLSAAFILALLFSAVVGTQLVSLAVASLDWPLPSYPDPNPPLISVQSPTQNQIYSSNNVWLNFTVTKPETWFSNSSVTTLIAVGYVIYGQIYFVRYNLDGRGSENIPANDSSYLELYQSPPRRNFDFSLKLTGLSEGPHSVIVSAEGESYYEGNNSDYWFANTVVGNSTKIDFNINAAPPAISILSPENKTYNATDGLLNFRVNEPVSWMAYSLDEGDKVAITGNTTLTGLSYGSHTVTVYANDTTGTSGTSKTITFNIAKPEPEPFPITWIATTVVIVTVVDAGLLFYFKKRNNAEIKDKTK